MTDGPSVSPRHWVDAAGATPAGVDAALRHAAAAVTGVDPARLPPAEPRVAPARSGADRSSALPMRVPDAFVGGRGGASVGQSSPGEAASPGDRMALAGRIAAELRADPWIDDAVARPPGVVFLCLAPVARASLVAAVGTGWDFLARGAEPSRSGRQEGEGEAEWARSALERADTLATAHAWARDDAICRLAAFLDAPGPVPPGVVSSDTAPPTPAGATISWRDPYQDVVAGDGPVARLLAAIGEPATRVALCRSATAHPRPGELTGPDLPARPTAEAPGAWACLTDANPAFVLRHAHAHAHTAVVGWAAGLGWAAGSLSLAATATSALPAPEPAAVAALDRPEARAVLDVLFEGPGHVAAARRRAQPHVLVRYLERLAAVYHDWWTSGHVIPTRDDVPTGEGNDDRDDGVTRTATAARLDLCAAVGGVLAAGLFLLGVSAPTVL